MATQIQSQQTGSSLLRRALQGNAVFSGLSGALFVVAATPLASFLGIDTPLVLMVLGVTLLLYAVALFRQAAQESINRQFTIAAILLDVAWVAGSIVLLLTGWVPFTTGGKWAVAIIADIVAVFAALQYFGLRRQ